MRRHVGFALAAAIAAPFLAAPRAFGQETYWDQMSAADADLTALAPKLATIARSLKAGGDASLKGNLTVVAERSDAEREAVADRLEGLWAKAAEALGSLGFATPSQMPALTVIVVRAKAGPSEWVKAPVDPVVLIREGAAARLLEPQPLAARADGAATRRDALLAALAVRRWQSGAQRAAATRSGEAYFVARQAVAASVAKKEVPVWAYEGLIAWTEQKLAGAAAPGHFCKPWTTPSPALLERVLAVGDAMSAVACRFLGRFVGALVAGRSDVPRLLPSLKGAGAGAIGAAFGTSAETALASVCDSAKGEAGACDEKGQMPCSSCKGAGKVELACPDCQGTGAFACPSCRGDNNCPSSCEDGFVTFETGRRVKCRVCSGGKLKCQACAGALRSPCKSCAGSGKGAWPCLSCLGSGRTVCPESGAAAEPVEGRPCPWCQDASRSVACPDCGGVGYTGCDACWGTLREVCFECIGTGEIRMVYTDGTMASSSKCKDCDGRGFTRCAECKGGRGECARCGGKGRGKPTAVFLGTARSCAACDDGTAASAEVLARRAGASAATVDEVEAERNQKMLDRAVAFLLTCNRTKNGAFALRRFRAKGAEAAGELMEPTLFSNADVLWTLAVVGMDVKDARLARAWDALREESRKIVDGTAEYQGTQAVAQAVRAFSAGGEDLKSPLLLGLIAKLVKGQHASGWWGDSLDGKDPDDPLDSLMAVEALRVARLKGARIPRTVWQKVLRVASAEFDSKGPGGRKAGFTTASEVLSNTALVVMSKEGSLGNKASGFDYASMPAVKKGLAWLDRYFDIRQEPAFVKGALFRQSSDAGYSAYIFAVQRLAMLLSIEVLGGDRWHASGARHLASIQHKDGSFEEMSPSHLNGPVRTTTSCVLFLARATTPITDVDDGE